MSSSPCTSRTGSGRQSPPPRVGSCGERHAGSMTSLRERLLSTVARQLGRPHGILSPFVARALNRGNQRAIAGAVEAAHTPRGGVAADIGFGGGVGLQLLLDRVGDDGVVHGIEIADARFGGAVRSGRLRLASGSLTETGFQDGSLDALITVNTVYFITELDAACAEL